MNAASASPAETRAETHAGSGDATAERARPVRVWDLPVRVFHWLAVLCFAGAWITAESERWRLLHVTLGYTLAGLVGFRILWGLVGTRHARFASFLRGPAHVMSYLRSMARGQPLHHTGHNPAGGWAIVALLLLPLAIVATGHALYNELGGDWLEDAHEALAEGTLALVGLHIAAVLVSSLLHRENLVRAMVTGYKRGQPEEGVRRAWRSVALIMVVAVAGFWWLQWRDAPRLDTPPAPATATATGQDRDHDDD